MNCTRTPLAEPEDYEQDDDIRLKAITVSHIRDAVRPLAKVTNPFYGVSDDEALR
jgi:hypothetical protein